VLAFAAAAEESRLAALPAFPRIHAEVRPKSELKKAFTLDATQMAASAAWANQSFRIAL
jgi:hypothetical protein